MFWTDATGEPGERPSRLGGITDADLVIVGGGFSGLWAAIQALEDDPGRRVIVLEAERCGHGASTRNGGFCDASLTHGIDNGVSHWPDEYPTLRRLGRSNLDGIERTLADHAIDADFERTGELGVATQPWQVEDLAEGAALHREHGDDVELLDAGAVRRVLDSPSFLGGLLVRHDVALVDPAKLCNGLRTVAERLGARIHEESPVTNIERGTHQIVVTTREGSVRTDQVLAATNAYRSPVRSARKYTIPVYDHVLMTEPLSSEQLGAIGWEGRHGVGDAANQFHYYRLSADNRILWGGYDATYHWNNGVHPRFDDQPETHETLARHFFETFPQLEGLHFTHRWGGPIATTTRFTAAWGVDDERDIAWVGGYTGLGVGASRFGARVALDLLSGVATERTELAMVRQAPMPFPPEPLRSLGVAITKRAIQRSDRNEGRRGPWLALLDRFGIGFDS